MYCLFVGKRLVTIKIFLPNFFFGGGGGQNARQNGNFCLYFENSRKRPILRLQMRAKEDFSRHQLFSTNKQYVSIKTDAQ